MSELKKQIRTDLSASMKAKDKTRTATLRMLLAAIQTEEVSGSKHELDNAGVLRLIARELKKRRESAEVYAQAGRQELADKELAEAEILEEYQPRQLDDAALAALVSESIAEVGGEVTMKQMGQVMKVATAKAAGQVDGKRLSTAVRAALQS